MFEILPLDITVAAANYYNIIGKPAMTHLSSKLFPIFYQVRSGSNLAITSSINSEGAVSTKTAFLAPQLTALS